ncbi:MAG: aldo/keto reductase [Lachnospiraceae bacterium]|nr:aldo/keto reductase [Lachnospiraceae bacterium]
MKKLILGKTGHVIPSVAIGCMRIADMEESALISHISYCMEHGLNFFDHADIYGGGECETLFGKAWKQTGCRREDMIIQSKCGIVPGIMYDLSAVHILCSVDNILTRLDTDYLDVLLLHRPDALMEPEQVAQAFDKLEQSGKVRYFGVSNQRPGQIELLKKCVRQDLLIDQLQLSIPFSGMVAAGMEANMLTDGAVDRDGGILDYCRLNDITIQAWSPFQSGSGKGIFIGDNDNYPELNQALRDLGEKYQATPTAIASAWIFRHPANIQMIAGTTKTSRLDEIIRGSEITLTREEWYRLYLAAGHILP